jgi:molybdopterin-guanine dinucleotide biosynthesis adapter protein
VKVAAIVGPSGAGKTTLIVELIRVFVADGRRVGAIKHTHHPLNEEHRGDTGRFRDAGASPVILAGRGEGVLFGDGGTSRTTFTRPSDLLRHFDCDVVLIEGFKDAGDWPQVTITADARPTIDEMRANPDRIVGFI